MDTVKEFVPPKRECGKCTACCQGTLSGEACGHFFFPGQPCHWVGESGCTVYEQRPPVCSGFKCSWLIDSFLPMWFQPNLSNIICTWQLWEDDSEGNKRSYLKAHSTNNGFIDPKYMRWLETSRINCVVLNGAYTATYLGSDEFKQWAINDRTKSSQSPEPDPPSEPDHT